MANPIWEFDPTSEDAANAALLLSEANGYGVIEFNPDAANQTVQWAASVDTEGALPASFKDENRSISMTVECTTAAALRSLQAKVAKISREHGTLKYTLPNSEVIVFDLLARESFKPTFDIGYFVHTGAFCSVSLSFTAMPYGRGPEQDLGDNVETTLPCLIFTDTGIKGDVPGLGRLVVDNDSATAKRVLHWGIQSRYYSSASTAALFYQAESCALFQGVVATGPAGASGGGSNNTVRVSSLTDGVTSWQEGIFIGASSSAQTHTGTFRVFVRAQAPGTNAGTVMLRASWSTGLSGNLAHTDWRDLADSNAAPLSDKWLLVDLGDISLPKSSTGTQAWIGMIDAASTVGSTDQVYLDWVMLVPTLEGSGELRSAGSRNAITVNGTAHIRYDGAYTNTAYDYTTGNYTTSATLSKHRYEGDHLFVPPSGAENRTVRVIVKLSSGSISDGSLPAVEDVTIDDLSARLFVTPRYLVVPSP